MIDAAIETFKRLRSLRPWSTEPPPRDATQMGEAARQLLNDPVLGAAWDRVQAKLIETWKQTAAGDTEAREAAYRLLWASEQAKAELRLMLANARAQARANPNQ